MFNHNEFESLTLAIAKTLINIQMVEAALRTLGMQKRRALQTYLSGGVLGRTLTMIQAEQTFKEGVKEKLTKNLDKLFRRRRYWMLCNPVRAAEPEVKLILEGKPVNLLQCCRFSFFLKISNRFREASGRGCRSDVSRGRRTRLFYRANSN